MKKTKFAISLFLCIILALYFIYLFLVPKLANFEKFTSFLENTISQQANVGLKFKNLNIKTSWDLALNANIQKIDLHTQNEKFAQVNGLKLKISLLPLIFKKVHISEIQAEKVLANVKPEYFLQQNNNINGFNISENLPTLKVGLYRISLLQGKDNYTLKGNNFEMSQSPFNKHIKLITKGKLILNSDDSVFYNLNIETNSFPKVENVDIKQKFSELSENFKNMMKYKVHCNLCSDIDILHEKEDLKIKGFTNINDIVFSYENKKFLPSNIQLKFNEFETEINSKINIDKVNSILVNGTFNYNKNKSLKLKVIGEDINVSILSSMIKMVGKSSGVKELQDIDLKGTLNANFDIKSDFKNITSKGYLKIQNASIYHRISKILISDINTNVDFSNNFIKIAKADAKFQSHPIKISGSIDKKANADLKITGENINTADIVKLVPQAKDYKVSGLLNFSAILKGQLKSVSPKISFALKNINLQNIKTGENIKIASSDVKAKYDKTLFANARMYNLNYSPDVQNSLLLPRLELNLADNVLTIEKTLLWINNIKSELSGEVINIDKTPEITALNVIIPNNITVPVKGYHGSKLTVKGNLKAYGALSKPSVNGLFTVPTLSLPSLATQARDITIKIASDDITVNCPSIRVGNSILKLAATADCDVSKGLIIKDVDIYSPFINLDELENNLKKQKAEDITILAGKMQADSVKLKGLQVENINCQLTAKKNMLYLRNIRGEAYTGEIAGDVNYDKAKIKTWAKLQGRNLSARLAIPALTNHKDDISGKLDFDGSISFSGCTPQDIRKTLSGNIKFQILNGKMGMLGKLEHLLYAQNIINNNILRTSLNLVTKAVTAKNTGVYKFMRGNIVMKDGVADIKYIKTSGPSMTLFIKGKLYIKENLAVMTILGRISNDVANVLGPIGEFTVEKAISSILNKPQPSKSNMTYFTQSDIDDYMQIPALNPKTNFKTREFRVSINGDPYKQTSVQSFEWLIKPANN